MWSCICVLGLSMLVMYLCVRVSMLVMYLCVCVLGVSMLVMYLCVRGIDVGCVFVC
jgi:hypothetical protein